MSNDRKSVNELDGADTEATLGQDTQQNTGQSRDALRHQKDAAHHKGYKGPQQDSGNSEPPAGGPARKTTQSE